MNLNGRYLTESERLKLHADMEHEEQHALDVEAQIATQQRLTSARYEHRTVAEVVREFGALGFAGFTAEYRGEELVIYGTGNDNIQRMLEAYERRMEQLNDRLATRDPEQVMERPLTEVAA